jgi:hypothetical protein
MMRRIALLAVAVAALALAACFRTHAPAIPVPMPPRPPAADSPQAAVRRFAWCWASRSADAYGESFTADFRGIFAPDDSAGIPYRTTPWLLEDELACAQHLFVGGGALPPASGIDIAIDNVLLAQPDPRPGRDSRWHRTVRTHAALRVTVPGGGGDAAITAVEGFALFYLVRGDSAAIPAQLLARGFGPDSTRWWIERWEDETAGAAPTGAGAAGSRRVLPTSVSTWFALKVAYRPSASTPALKGRTR